MHCMQYVQIVYAEARVQTMKAQTGLMYSSTLRPLYPQEIDLVPTVQENGRASKSVWPGVENLAPTGIQLTDRPASSKSLYRLSYPNPLECRSHSQM